MKLYHKRVFEYNQLKTHKNNYNHHIFIFELIKMNIQRFLLIVQNITKEEVQNFPFFLYNILCKIETKLTKV